MRFVFRAIFKRNSVSLPKSEKEFLLLDFVWYYMNADNLNK